MKRFMKRMICVMLVCVTMLSASINISATGKTKHPATVLITEVCFNPAYKENDQDIDENSDIFKFIEIYNASDAAVSLEGATLTYSADSKAVRQNDILCAGNTAVLGTGEIAVIALYHAVSNDLSLKYVTARDKTELYTAYATYYGFGASVDQNHFYISPCVESGSEEPIEGSFDLDNVSENATLTLAGGDDTILGSVEYTPSYYNRNNRAVAFQADGTMLGATHPTPGALFDNQYADTSALVSTKITVDLKAVEYNICASGIPNRDGDTNLISDRYDEVFGMIEEENPDILGLCEVNYAWHELLDTEFIQKNGYSVYGFSSQGNDYEKKTAKEKWDLYNLVLWKTDKYDVLGKGHFWCSSTPNRANSFTWSNGTTGDFARCINWVILKDKASGLEFFFLCAHIDAKVEDARNQSVTLITQAAERYADGRPIIMLGDWNANISSDAYGILNSGNFADARFRTTETDLHGTYNKWGEYLADYSTRLPIDHCIISKDKIFVKSYSQRIGIEQDDGSIFLPSDHNMTVFNLQLPTNEDKPVETAASAVTTVAADTTAATANSGCGSVMGMTSLLPLAVLCAGVVIGKKKR